MAVHAARHSYNVPSWANPVDARVFYAVAASTPVWRTRTCLPPAWWSFAITAPSGCRFINNARMQRERTPAPSGAYAAATGFCPGKGIDHTQKYDATPKSAAQRRRRFRIHRRHAATVARTPTNLITGASRYLRPCPAPVLPISIVWWRVDVIQNPP